MNPYKLNSISGHCYRKAICEGLGINSKDIYKTIENIKQDGTIITKKGEKFKVELKKIY